MSEFPQNGSKTASVLWSALCGAAAMKVKALIWKPSVLLMFLSWWLQRCENGDVSVQQADQQGVQLGC